MSQNTRTTTPKRESLEEMFEPSSIAVVGASTDETKRGNMAIKSVLQSDYEADVYPVNPKYDTDIRGQKVYESVSAIPTQVDLVLVTTPAPIVPSVLEDCGQAGASGAVVIASGFAEVGDTEQESALREAIEEYDVRVVGPNTQGIADPTTGLNLLGQYELPEGNVAIVAQSGGIILDMDSVMRLRQSAGASYVVGCGNQADIGFHEYVQYFDDHEPTDVIFFHAEEMDDGRAFLQEASQVSRRKPIVVQRGGRTEAGRESSSRHTASSGGKREHLEAAYQQAGVVHVERADEAVEVAETLSKLDPPSGSNVAIFGDSGGHATLSSDRCTEHGLSLPELAEETQQKLSELVPTAPNVSNPVDIMGLQGDGDYSIFNECAEVILEDPSVDVLLVTGSLGGYSAFGPGGDREREREAVEEIASLADVHDKPVLFQCNYGEVGTEVLSKLEDHDVPTFGSIDTAISCVAALVEYGEHLRCVDEKSDFVLSDGPSSGASERLSTTIGASDSPLTGTDAMDALRATEIPVAASDERERTHVVDITAVDEVGLLLSLSAADSTEEVHRAVPVTEYDARSMLEDLEYPADSAADELPKLLTQLSSLVVDSTVSSLADVAIALDDGAAVTDATIYRS